MKISGWMLCVLLNRNESMRILLTSKTIWNYSSRLFSTNKYKMAAYVKDVYDKLKSSEVESDYKLVKIKGIPQNPTFKVDEYESLIENFESRDGDVFLVTYVKAGTTWTQQIVHLLTRDGEAGGFYSETAPWLEALTSDMIGPREAPTWSLEKVNAVPLDQRRYFKSHANVEHLPNQKSPKKVKVIYVARNPKDTVVSLYHHAKSKPEFGYTGGFDKFCEIFLAGQAENGDWFTHVLDWYNECKVSPLTPCPTIQFIRLKFYHDFLIGSSRYSFILTI